MNNSQKFNKHEVVWTEEKIKNFWNYFVTNEELQELSFAKEAGKGIVKMVKAYIKRDGNNLDYGCGSGNLMAYLFEQGIACQGLDSSDKSIKTIEEKFKDNKFFKGAILSIGLPHRSIADNKYDFVFIIEAIEHLLANQLTATLTELYRIVKPGGYVFITAPNKEKLDRYKVICPDCGAVFHRVQHLNTFDSLSLEKLMADAGFTKVFCRATFLPPVRNFINILKYNLELFLARLAGRKPYQPHLVYLGKKV